jgi:SMC interacting uncharacterized protein involved in chromosome segregation
MEEVTQMFAAKIEEYKKKLTDMEMELGATKEQNEKLKAERDDLALKAELVEGGVSYALVNRLNNLEKLVADLQKRADEPEVVVVNMKHTYKSVAELIKKLNKVDNTGISLYEHVIRVKKESIEIRSNDFVFMFNKLPGLTSLLLRNGIGCRINGSVKVSITYKNIESSFSIANGGFVDSNIKWNTDRDSINVNKQLTRMDKLGYTNVYSQWICDGIIAYDKNILFDENRGGICATPEREYCILYHTDVFTLLMSVNNVVLMRIKDIYLKFEDGRLTLVRAEDAHKLLKPL